MPGSISEPAGSEDQERHSSVRETATDARDSSLAEYHRPQVPQESTAPRTNGVMHRTGITREELDEHTRSLEALYNDRAGANGWPQTEWQGPPSDTSSMVYQGMEGPMAGLLERVLELEQLMSQATDPSTGLRVLEPFMADTTYPLELGFVHHAGLNDLLTLYRPNGHANALDPAPNVLYGRPVEPFLGLSETREIAGWGNDLGGTGGPGEVHVPHRLSASLSISENSTTES